MSDETDHDSRTEEPTEKKLRDAMERGDIPVSRDVPQALFLGGLFAILALALPARTKELVVALTHMIDDPGGWRLEQSKDAIALLSSILVAAAVFLLPILSVIAMTGLIGSFSQNAPRVVVDRIMPDLSRISIRKGLTRLLGPRGWVELGKSTAKLLVMLGVTIYVVWAGKERMLQLVWTDVGLLPETMVAQAKTLIIAMGLVTLTIASADLVWARLLWRRDQRMTKQEIKEEVRQAEGDRLVKARLRSLQRDRSRKRMLAAVPNATMVIANPTHYAIALRYVHGQSGAPTVVAKGMDLIALKIREIAEKSDIPVIEDKLLARSLYGAVEVDQAIPPDFYHAVAEIVHQLRAKSNVQPRAEGARA